MDFKHATNTVLQETSWFSIGLTEQSALSFETAVFSPYLLASTEVSQGGDTEKAAAAKTGDAIPTGLIALLGFACLASAATLVVSSRKRG